MPRRLPFPVIPPVRMSVRPLIHSFRSRAANQKATARKRALVKAQATWPAESAGKSFCLPLRHNFRRGGILRRARSCDSARALHRKPLAPRAFALRFGPQLRKRAFEKSLFFLSLHSFPPFLILLPHFGPAHRLESESNNEQTFQFSFCKKKGIPASCMYSARSFRPRVSWRSTDSISIGVHVLSQPFPKSRYFSALSPFLLSCSVSPFFAIRSSSWARIYL